MYSDFQRDLGLQQIDEARDLKLKAVAQELKRDGTEDCIDCGRAIPADRRRVYPSATRCIDCQEIAEREAYTK